MPSSSTENSALLPPPSFQLPEDFDENPEDYEVWSMRAPVKFDLSVLNGCALQFNLGQDGRRAKGERNYVTTFELGGEKYSITKEDVNEVSSCRILAASGDEDGKGMKPLPVPFTKHFSVVKTTNANITDVDLAPSSERATNVDMDTLQMRIPYTHIDQKKNLKRRWNVMGANATWVPPPESPTVVPMNTTSPSPSSSKKKSDKSGKKKKEKKTAKKAGKTKSKS
mmetsp:Transcript_8184/g.9534  ORF Transcript_8184/g.9534 Transcript_8184/m.9534 type:complete len:225 (+) Transcript_8184:32-706(+)